LAPQGRIGRRGGRIKIAHYENHALAAGTLQRLAERKRRRGYACKMNIAPASAPRRCQPLPSIARRVNKIIIGFSIVETSFNPDDRSKAQ